MVSLDRATTSFYRARLLLVTMVPCTAVWSQFSMQDFNLLVAVSQKRSAIPSDRWASCIYRFMPVNLILIFTLSITLRYLLQQRLRYTSWLACDSVAKVTKHLRRLPAFFTLVIFY